MTDDRSLILTYLAGVLSRVNAEIPPPCGGMPHSAHIAGWARRDVLEEVIEWIENMPKGSDDG